MTAAHSSNLGIEVAWIGVNFAFPHTKLTTTSPDVFTIHRYEKMCGAQSLLHLQWDDQSSIAEPEILEANIRMLPRLICILLGEVHPIHWIASCEALLA